MNIEVEGKLKANTQHLRLEERPIEFARRRLQRLQTGERAASSFSQSSLQGVSVPDVQRSEMLQWDLAVALPQG
eukprot:2219137-Heterocapsa_arctica.AAC.1